MDKKPLIWMLCVFLLIIPMVQGITPYNYNGGYSSTITTGSPSFSGLSVSCDAYDQEEHIGYTNTDDMPDLNYIKNLSIKRYVLGTAHGQAGYPTGYTHLYLGDQTIRYLTYTTPGDSDWHNFYDYQNGVPIEVYVRANESAGENKFDVYYNFSVNRQSQITATSSVLKANGRCKAETDDRYIIASTFYYITITEWEDLIYATDSFTSNNIDNFSVYVSNSTWNKNWVANGTTTRSNLTSGVYNFTITHTNYNNVTYENYNITLNNSLNAFMSGLSYSVLNLSIYDEEDETLITGVNITISQTSDSYSQSNDTDNGTFYDDSENLLPDFYHFQLTDDSNVWDDNNYYADLQAIAQGINNINLYMLNSSLTSESCWNIYDETQNPINAYIKLLRHYPSDNSYKTVSMAQTDGSGEARINVITGTVTYKYQIYTDLDSPPVYTSPPQYLQATSCYTHYITTGMNIGEDWFSTAYISYSWYYNNETNTTVFSWSDPDNLLTQVCIDTDKIGAHTTNIDYSCTISASGQIYHPIPQVEGTYMTTATAIINDSSTTVYIDAFSKEINFNTAQILGRSGMLLVLLLLIVMTFAGMWAGGVGIMFLSLGLLLVKATGLLLIPLPIVMAIIIFGIIIMLVNKK